MATREPGRSTPRLPFGPDEGPEALQASSPASPVDSRIAERDRAGRERAVDPRFNVALEASAGTGKTRVLVDRYINLLKLGVDPSNILAITFTRKAAAEMRERIVGTLRAVAERGEMPPARWRELRDRAADIAISTIDAFCLSLLREFPLEADLDPGFSLADETEVPRLVDDALDRALRICRALAADDEEVALVFAHLGERRARHGLAILLQRRLVAPDLLRKHLASGLRDLTVAAAARRAASALVDAFGAMPGGLDGFIHTGPPEPAFLLLSRDLRRLQAATTSGVPLDPVAVQGTFARVREHFLTQDGEPRRQLAYRKALFPSGPAFAIHRDLVLAHGADILRVSDAFRRDLNVLVSHGIYRMYRIAETEYRRTLDAHAVLDFSDLLQRALDLLRQREEFSQSRYRLESRYHHLLLDEFQDTSRAQWELVSLLIESWGSGEGAAYSGPLPPSIFIVGDRKQSIYAFRDADVSLMHEAARHLDGLRRDGDVRRSISRSFRSVPALLAFVNDVCADIDKMPARPDAFSYEEQDRFPVDDVPASASPPIPHSPPTSPALADGAGGEVLGLVAGDTPEACATVTAAEITRLLESRTTVRDRDTGVYRAIRAGDIAILFRTRESHREFEAALERRGIPAYVYKGLGFFDTDEIKDVLALLWYLADPSSDLRAAALMRSRFVRVSDEGLRLLAPHLADALRGSAAPDALPTLDAHDRAALGLARETYARWRGLVDRLPPAELLDVVLAESAYALEMRGPHFQQARENLKKMRGLVRRIQNRGYATLGRLAAHLDRLTIGDESNASIDALDSVNLMTVHASKGLEFPVAFLVNLGRGTGNRRDPIRVSTDPSGTSVSVGEFQSAADDDLMAKEREETKRLLYVAMTRARDRLYLGSVLKDGQVAASRGSLADVLPRPLLSVMSGSPGVGSSGDSRSVMSEWRASSGGIHRFRVCQPPEDVAVSALPTEVTAGEAPGVSADFEPLVSSSPARVTIASATGGRGQASEGGSGTESDRVLGTLVHRLLDRIGMVSDIGSERLHAVALGMLRPEEAGEAGELQALVDRAVDTYRALCGREDVRALYNLGDRLYEVPFTMRTADAFLRGTIDCLIRHDDRLTVLEFKTGRPRPEHQAQVDLYRQAAEQMFPGVRVDARLIYAQGEPGSKGSQFGGGVV